MARYCIEKGNLDENGLRVLTLHTMDANGEWNETVFGRLPDTDADQRIAELIKGGRMEPWPPS